MTLMLRPPKKMAIGRAPLIKLSKWMTASNYSPRAAALLIWAARRAVGRKLLPSVLAVRRKKGRRKRICRRD